MAVQPLPPEALYTPCTLDHVDFTTTADLDATASSSSARSGPSPPSSWASPSTAQGYNIFALGPSGTGKYTVIEHFVEQRAAAEPPPDDWCYVNDFEQPSQPRALRLPAGMGKRAAARHGAPGRGAAQRPLVGLRERRVRDAPPRPRGGVPGAPARRASTELQEQAQRARPGAAEHALRPGLRAR